MKSHSSVISSNESLHKQTRNIEDLFNIYFMGVLSTEDAKAGLCSRRILLLKSIQKKNKKKKQTPEVKSMLAKSLFDFHIGDSPRHAFCQIFYRLVGRVNTAGFSIISLSLVPFLCFLLVIFGFPVYNSLVIAAILLKTVLIKSASYS